MKPKELRESLSELGWKQGEFAFRMGVDPDTVSRWVNDRHKIPKSVSAYLRLLKRVHEDVERSVAILRGIN